MDKLQRREGNLFPLVFCAYEDAISFHSDPTTREILDRYDTMTEIFIRNNEDIITDTLPGFYQLPASLYQLSVSEREHVERLLGIDISLRTERLEDYFKQARVYYLDSNDERHNVAQKRVW